MESLQRIQSYLDEELCIYSIEDACSNGLEITGKNEIKKIAFMVDPSEEGILEAINRNADMIIVHHGLFFGSIKKIDGFLYRRIQLLIEHSISLYAAHLPLDVHPALGNNAQVAKVLSLLNVAQYDVKNYKNLLTIGEFEKPLLWNDFLEVIRQKISPEIRSFHFGSNTVHRVGIITGSGAEASCIAAHYGADTFITGESKLQAYHESKESAINIVFAGHYYTEVFGLQALQQSLANLFSLDTEFIDIPTIL